MKQEYLMQSHLTRLGRRLRLRDGWLLAQRLFWVACLASVLILLAGRIWPLEHIWLWASSPLAVWLLAVAIISLVRPLTPMRIARRADAELGLMERLATAVELQDCKTALSALQRQDALSIVKSVDSRQAFPLCWSRRPLLLAAFFIVSAVALTILPNPMDDILAERAAVAQVAKEQAREIDELRQEIEDAQELTPAERAELLRQLAELAEQLRTNPGDREEALADLAQVEKDLQQKIDLNAIAREANLEALTAQLAALAGDDTGESVDLEAALESLENLAEALADMDASDREMAARALAQMAGRAAQAGNTQLAQALASLAQAAQSGDNSDISQTAQAAAQSLEKARNELAGQSTLRQALTQMQESRRAISRAGQGQIIAQQGQGQGQTGGQGQGQGQPGGGGGTQANTLPPAQRTGQADPPQGEGQPGVVGELNEQVYVPWDRRQGEGEAVTISGSDTGQGETQVREQEGALPGAAGRALLPYHEVYYNYLNAANQNMERDYIPAGLEDYVREYFSHLEP